METNTFIIMLLTTITLSNHNWYDNTADDLVKTHFHVLPFIKYFLHVDKQYGMIDKRNVVGRPNKGGRPIVTLLSNL